MHPCKDAAGDRTYDFFIENLMLPTCAKPQCVNLTEVLEKALADGQPNLTELKQILVALIES